jgi:hypothetical protein
MSHVNDSKAVEMEIQDLGGLQDPGLPHRFFAGGLEAAARSAWRLGSCRLIVGLLVGGRLWELLRDDAAEGQECPLSVRSG